MCWLDDKLLAVCDMQGFIQVHAITQYGHYPAFTLRSSSWQRDKADEDDDDDSDDSDDDRDIDTFPIGLAAIKSTVETFVLVICDEDRFVYQFPCRESNQEKKRFPICRKQDDVNPLSIIANQSNIAIGLTACVLLYGWPEFVWTTKIGLTFQPFDLCWTCSNTLVLMGKTKICARKIENPVNDLYKIKASSESQFDGVVIEESTGDIYIASQRHGVESVHQCKRKGIDEFDSPTYLQSFSVIDDCHKASFRGISLSTGGLLALVEWQQFRVNIFKLKPAPEIQQN